MKFAIIGFGSIGRRHLENLLLLGVDDVVVVSSHFTGNQYITNGHIVPVVTDIIEILDAIDVMVICNPTNLHKYYLELCIEHSIHVYVEKPVLCSCSQMDGLLQKIEKNKIIAAVGSQFRFNRCLLKIKKILDSHILGQIMSVVSLHGEHLADYHPNEDYTKSYTANKSQCGGVLLTQIHHIDYINWIFGPFTHVSASSINASALNNIDVESIVNYSLLSSDSGLCVHGHMNYLQRPKSTKMLVIGEYGELHWDYESNLLKVITADDVTEEGISVDRNDMFIDAMSSFIQSVKLVTKSVSSIDAGIQSLKIVDSIKQSIESKSQVVSIN